MIINNRYITTIYLLNQGGGEFRRNSFPSCDYTAIYMDDIYRQRIAPTVKRGRIKGEREKERVNAFIMVFWDRSVVLRLHGVLGDTNATNLGLRR